MPHQPLAHKPLALADLGGSHLFRKRVAQTSVRIGEGDPRQTSVNVRVLHLDEAEPQVSLHVVSWNAQAVAVHVAEPQLG